MNKHICLFAILLALLLPLRTEAGIARDTGGANRNYPDVGYNRKIY